MNVQEAKFILRAYRTGGSDASDAAFCEALELVRRDPELGRWFAREQGLDKAVVAKLGEVAVPAGLREAILTGARVSARQRAWWRQPVWLAMAASVALVFAAMTWLLRPGGAVSIDRLAEFAAADLRSPLHGAGAPPKHELAAKLADPALRLAVGLPFGFDRLSAMGCRTLKLGGHDVLETCFHRGSVDFHLYVMVRESSQSAGIGPEFSEKKGLSTMAWTDARYVYVVASTAGVDQLKSLL